MQTPNELLPDGLQIDLLWTNASPTSEFAKQFIYIDTSRYTMLLIEISDDTTSLNFNTTLVLPKKNIRFPSFVMDTPTAWKRRDFVDFVDKIQVGIGYKCSINGGLVENNSVSIPLNIWGIR